MYRKNFLNSPKLLATQSAAFILLKNSLYSQKYTLADFKRTKFKSRFRNHENLARIQAEKMKGLATNSQGRKMLHIRLFIINYTTQFIIGTMT